MEKLRSGKRSAAPLTFVRAKAQLTIDPQPLLLPPEPFCPIQSLGSIFVLILRLPPILSLSKYLGVI